MRAPSPRAIAAIAAIAVACLAASPATTLAQLPSQRATTARAASPTPPFAQPNDNRVPAGVRRGRTIAVYLEFDGAVPAVRGPAWLEVVTSYYPGYRLTFAHTARVPVVMALRAASVR